MNAPWSVDTACKIASALSPEQAAVILGTSNVEQSDGTSSGVWMLLHRAGLLDDEFDLSPLGTAVCVQLREAQQMPRRTIDGKRQYTWQWMPPQPDDVLDHKTSRGRR